MKMYIKKKYSKILSLLIILAIFINITAIIPVKNARAEEVAGVAETTEEAGMVLYRSGKAEGEYVSLEDALNAMTDPKGDYKIVFKQNRESYELYGDIELPEVSSITLTGIYEVYTFGEGLADIFVTTVNVDSNIYLNSDLTLENIDICNINKNHDSEFVLQEHTLELKGEHVDIKSEGHINLFSLVGNQNSYIIIDNLDFDFSSNIYIGTIILKNEANLICRGNFNKIYELVSYGENSMYSNGIAFLNTTDRNIYCDIENIKIYKYLNISAPTTGKMDIGSIEQCLYTERVTISSAYDSFREDLYCHINIREYMDGILQLYFYIDNFLEKDYTIFCNTSVLCAPNIPATKIEYLLQCNSHPEWKAGKVFKDIEGNIWLEPIEEKEDEALCYKLDEQSRDEQKIYYSLDTENKTAIVGKDSNVLNTAGYKGANNGKVIIPSYVEKDGIQYTVTGIGSNSFAGGHSIRIIEIADTVKSIGVKAFSDICIDRIYIGSGLDSIGDDGLGAFSLSRIYVNPRNQNFFSYNNILFDNKCETLIKFPLTYSLEMRNYSVPYPVKTIADGAFKHTRIRNIIFADSVTTIGKEAFSRCTNLESLSGNNIEKVKEKAFYGCENLNYFYAGNNLKIVESEVFNFCKSIEWLFFPDNILMADEAFLGMDKLKYFLGAKNAQYGKKLFGYCNSLSFVSLSEYMENIPENFFFGCSSLEKLYIPKQYTSCDLSAFLYIKDGQCTVYGEEEQRKFFIRASVKFEDKSEHEHIMLTETIAEPGERTYGAEVTYCTYCHYIEEGKLIPPTGTQATIPTISRPVLKTPAPVANETLEPTEIPAPEETKEPETPETPVPENTPEPGTSVTPVPENTPEPGNTTEPPSSSKPPEDNNTGSNGGGSSGGGGGGGSSSGGGGSAGGGGGFGGGGGAGAAGGSQPAATQTPVPSEPPSGQPVSSSATPQATPGVTIPAAEPSQAPSPSPSPGLDNTYGRIEVYSFSLKLDKNNHAKLKWNKNPDAAGYIIYRSTKRNKDFNKIHTIKKPSKNFYTDKKVSPGKRYYYRICAYRLYGKTQYTGRYSSIQSIKTLYLIKPKIKAAKGKTAGNIKYIKLDLKKYSGTDIAVYIRGSNKKYKRLELIESSIKKYNASFKLRYNSKKKNCYIKVKTFINKNGQKYYSAYSNIAKVKM